MECGFGAIEYKQILVNGSAASVVIPISNIIQICPMTESCSELGKLSLSHNNGFICPVAERLRENNGRYYIESYIVNVLHIDAPKSNNFQSLNNIATRAGATLHRQQNIFGFYQPKVNSKDSAKVNVILKISNIKKYYKTMKLIKYLQLNNLKLEFFNCLFFNIFVNIFNYLNKPNIFKNKRYS